VCDDFESELKRKDDIKEGDGGFVRVWIPQTGADEKSPANEVKEVKYVLVRGAAVDAALETFGFDNGARVWIERKNASGDWVRSAIKKVCYLMQI